MHERNIRPPSPTSYFLLLVRAVLGIIAIGAGFLGFVTTLVKVQAGEEPIYISSSVALISTLLLIGIFRISRSVH